MFRIYRGIILTISGLVLVGATPLNRKDEKTDQTEKNNRVENALEAIAVAQKEAVQPSEQERPCDQGNDNRQSDLCAQWKAADAAGESARWTFWTFIVSIFGTVGIIATIFYARSSIIASVNAERPHVRLYRTKKQNRDDGIIVQGVNFRNYGRTPAIIKKLSIEYVLAETPPKPRNCPIVRIYPDDMVMPQDEEWPRKHFVPPMDGQPLLRDIIPLHNKDGKRLFVYGEIVYRDAFKKNRVTGFCRVWDGSNFTYNQTDVNGQNDLNYTT